jgi:eukaryotic-like serine/threonine-protein kinase
MFPLPPTPPVSDPKAPPADAELRSHLERILAGVYDLEQELGRGGMGVVYKARDRRLKRTVAVKVLPPELGYRSEIRVRFLREAETAAQLSHPNIVPIYSVDERDGLVYFVMAFVDGDNLAQRLVRHGAMEPEQARRMLRDIAEALAYAHRRNVIHRDIKPDNILLDQGSGRPMVTDFGIARAISEGADARLTATGIAIGTPAYMSPEQSAGDKEVDGRADLYALGVVAYQMLSGEPPFIASSTPAMLVKHLSERPTPVQFKRPGIPADLAAIVMCLLEKSPADRFESAEALIAALDGAGPVPVARPVAPRGPSSWSPMPDIDPTEPTSDELMRWNAPVVNDFRRRMIPFIVVNSVILGLSVFTGFDAIGITAIWSVFLSFKYAKLWSEGYDWRDVFRQRRDRMFFDVVAESVDDVRAVFDHEKREQVRARWQSRRHQPGLTTPPSPRALGSGLTDQELQALGGARADVVRQAMMDRHEVSVIVAALPERERKQLGDVNGTAQALMDRIKGLAFALAEIDRSPGLGGATALEREIAQLEAQANPLDREASEARVRRLAMLKRDRRHAAEQGTRRADLDAKLQSCSLALQNLRFDVLRLSTGGATTANVTLVAEQAMSLARDVDALVAERANARRTS